MYRSFVLTSGEAEMVCWLEDDKRLNEGRTLTLKGDERTWTVKHRHATTLAERPSNWSNWKVGGLT